MTQFACALNWFNPLMWFAGRQMQIERERACDDLVLSAGVRPSTYAEHLVELVSRLRPAALTRSCGLAMARNSSLEGRLLAVLSEKLNRRGVNRAVTAAVLILGAAVAIPVAMLRAADAKWTPPQAAHVGTNEFSTYCDHDGKTAAFVIAYHGELGSSSTYDSNPQTRTWTSTGTLTAKQPGVAFSFHRAHTAPDKLTITVAPADARDLSKPASAPRESGQKEYDLTKGRVFLVSDDGVVRQLTIEAPVITESEQAKRLAERLAAAIPPQTREQTVPQPKGKEAQSLFKVWQAGARMDGKIPGGALGSLARAAARFVKHNPTDERAPKLAEFLKRIDMSHDWTPAEAVALLDDVTAIYPSLPEWAVDEPRFTLGGAVQTGQPLPAELENAPWGQTQPNGLRTAWLLDPRAEEHRLGTPLKSRILFHNAGQSLVVFRALTWNQSGHHQAHDAKGAKLSIVSTEWTTIPRIVACRLAPGEFLEVTAAGIGVGTNKDDEDWRGIRVGSWIEAKPGDEVTFTPAPVSLTGNFTDERAKGEPGWWLDFIKERLSRDLPLPVEAAERGRLLDRAVRDLFGTAPTLEEAAAFVRDRAPDGSEALAKHLAKRAGTSSFTGTLQSGPTTFRVLPADPDAAKRPRNASNPGRYTLGEHIRLIVTRRGVGERIVNEASIRFFSPDPTKPAPGEPHELKLPDGYGTWAAAWMRGGTVLWLQEQSGGIRRYDFADPAKVKEEAEEPGKVPAGIREALRAALPAPAPPATEGGTSGPSPPVSISAHQGTNSMNVRRLY
jgi:hypothetical protein